MTILPRAALLAAVLAALAVSGCGGGAGKTERGRSTVQGDADPHPGVRRAHGLPVQGIDVSKYQGDIDWARVRDADISFAYLKVSEGGDHIDDRFYDYWEGAAAAGVPRGAYHFMYWCRTASEQAVWFSQAVPQDRNQLPPVLDLEWNNASPTCPNRVSTATALEMIDVMLRAMERHTGKKPIIYTDINFHKDVLVGQLPGHEFWLRSVAAEPQDRFSNRPWTMWQYTATGRVPGIKGDVDRNAFIGSEKDWKRWLKARGVNG